MLILGSFQVYIERKLYKFRGIIKNVKSWKINKISEMNVMFQFIFNNVCTNSRNLTPNT